VKIPNLSEISAPVEKELKTFSSVYKSSMKSDVTLVDIVTSYILKQKGKKVRPLLVLLSAKAAGGVSERSYRGAALVELLHTATLVHDDVVDSAEVRRGFPSINAIWKNKVAVLIGDYLLSRGLLIAMKGKDYDFLEIITDTVKRMAEGELLQMKKTRKLDIDEETYFRVISDKTASLIETCCQIGAKSASGDTKIHDALRNYGEKLGLAFQIRDDILDYEGTKSLFGKEIGGDIKDKKITLPLIYAFNSVENSKKKEIRSLIKKGGDDAVKTVISFVREHNGIKLADDKAHEIAHEAVSSLSVLPESDAKLSLINLVNFVVERKN